MTQPPTGGERKRAMGTSGMTVAGGVLAVGSALLGFLFAPLWILTFVSIVYLIYAFASRKKA